MSIQEGIYFIQTPNSDAGIATGPISRVYAPPPAPIRILGGPFLNKWRLDQQNGGFVITERNPNARFSITRKNDTVWFSLSNADDVVYPMTWSVEPTGSGEFVIKEPTEDLVFTLAGNGAYGGPGVVLRPADGSPSQRWTLTRLGDD